ncbi:unnamed protein product [Prunus armeniaca]|uniref:Uncharacterized protein n=1 Tax=Prunus armeniaca TaxID=36596 RepID=A0A6J5XCT5_PRUAR|nr:unnamed protein product [Prunus armeniaca]CAB4311746.1 unnamed protein product [Prunus armeniaca]
MRLISSFFIRLLTLLILIVSSFSVMQSPHYVHADPNPRILRRIRRPPPAPISASGPHQHG